MIIIIIALWVLMIVIGVNEGKKKGEGCISFVMLLLLGPFWLPVIYLSKGNRIKCPFCAEQINKDAKICPHCRSAIK